MQPMPAAIPLTNEPITPSAATLGKRPQPAAAPDREAAAPVGAAVSPEPEAIPATKDSNTPATPAEKSE
jgi:hypothetical protein